MMSQETVEILITILIVIIALGIPFYKVFVGRSFIYGILMCWGLLITCHIILVLALILVYKLSNIGSVENIQEYSLTIGYSVGLGPFYGFGITILALFCRWAYRFLKNSIVVRETGQHPEVQESDGNRVATDGNNVKL